MLVPEGASVGQCDGCEISAIRSLTCLAGPRVRPVEQVRVRNQPRRGGRQTVRLMALATGVQEAPRGSLVAGALVLLLLPLGMQLLPAPGGPPMIAEAVKIGPDKQATPLHLGSSPEVAGPEEGVQRPVKISVKCRALKIKTGTKRDPEGLWKQALIDYGSNKTLHDLCNENPAKLVHFDRTILSHRDLMATLEGDKMAILYQKPSSLDPEIQFVIAGNQFELLVARKINKFYYWQTAQTALAGFIFFMIVVGNFSIIHRLKSCRRRRSNVNFFIVQLAVADLLVGLFSVSLDAVLRYQKVFSYGRIACKLYKYLSVLFIYSSTYLLVALSIDRWEAVVKPLAFTQNRSRGCYLVLGSWLLALISASPVTWSTTIKDVDGLPQCWIDYDNYAWKVYMIYLASSLLVIPATLIAVCYAHIVWTIWSKGRSVAKQQRLGEPVARRQSSRPGKPTNPIDLPQGDGAPSVSSSSEADECANSRRPVTRLPSAAKSQLNSSSTVQNNTGAQQISSPTPRKTGGRKSASGSRLSSLADEHDELSRDTEDDYMSTDEDEEEEEEEDDDDDDYDDEKYAEGDGHLPAGQVSGDKFEMYHIVSIKNNELTSNGHKQLKPHGQKPGKTIVAIAAGSSETTCRQPQNLDAVSGCKLPAAAAASEISCKSKKIGRRRAKEARRSYVAQQHGSGVIPKARIKTIKMTLVIVAAFILCWSPFYVINLCSVFGLAKGDTGIMVALSTLSQSLAHLNSAVNPIIFWLFSSKRNSSTAASSSDARGSQRQNKRAISLWTSMKHLLCFRLCCCCGIKSTRFTTNSRMFDSTGTSALAGSIRLPSSMRRKPEARIETQ